MTPHVPLSSHIRLDWLDANVPWIAIGTAEITELGTPPEPLDDVLVAAIRRGVRVIDTAPNYYDGQAESSVGRVIADTAHAADDVYVLTKAGQLTQGEMRDRAAKGLAPHDQHWCFDRDFLEMSIDRSMRRLGKRQLDCVLLHNPEDAIGPGERAEQVLADAIATLERMCCEKIVRGWGIASWSGLFRPPGSAGSIQLSQFCRSLEQEYKNHHFVAIELPMGLWNLQEFCAHYQVAYNAARATMNVAQVASALDINLLLSSPFCGARALPHSRDKDAWPSAPQHALLKTRTYAPSSLRIVGMRSSHSVHNSTILMERTDLAAKEL
jgi:aryl-alcohol dehydrogenase-like predicted oxidoreductase